MNNTSKKFTCIPYDISKPAIFFSDSEELEKLTKAAGIEEYEIDTLDLDNEDSELFEKIKAKAGSLKAFEMHEEGDLHYTWEKAAFCYLLDMGYDVEAAFDKYERVSILSGDLKDYAEELIEEMDLNPTIKWCIDVDLYAREISHDGNFCEITFGSNDYLITNHNEKL